MKQSSSYFVWIASLALAMTMAHASKRKIHPRGTRSSPLHSKLSATPADGLTFGL
jgi:hypothetical protein